ncbi:MAG: hypothetical protein NVS4B1_00820 [Ktedonobacteraceae bacterium]
MCHYSTDKYHLYRHQPLPHKDMMYRNSLADHNQTWDEQVTRFVKTYTQLLSGYDILEGMRPSIYSKHQQAH